MILTMTPPFQPTDRCQATMLGQQMDLQHNNHRKAGHLPMPVVHFMTIQLRKVGPNKFHPQFQVWMLAWIGEMAGTSIGAVKMKPKMKKILSTSG
mmetsp:Transcript_29837/g.57339  ORF Transcript_29837/g.57339 Transcript_29837/m.57339 type:complete len:95 (-) Transcript_29837:54-338(-)